MGREFRTGDQGMGPVQSVVHGMEPFQTIGHKMELFQNTVLGMSAVQTRESMEWNRSKLWPLGWALSKIQQFFKAPLLQCICLYPKRRKFILGFFIHKEWLNFPLKLHKWGTIQSCLPFRMKSGPSKREVTAVWYTTKSLWLINCRRAGPSTNLLYSSTMGQDLNIRSLCCEVVTMCVAMEAIFQTKSWQLSMAYESLVTFQCL